MTEFIYDDGGRSKYFKGIGGDCVTRAIAIVSGLDYKEIYDKLAIGNKEQKTGKYQKKTKAGKKTALHGINVKHQWFKDFMGELGFIWIPTMKIGEGCKVHLCANELPGGRLIIAVSRHYTAMIDGIIHDTYSPQRIWSSPYNGEPIKTNEFVTEANNMIHKEKRCVYGYWIKKD